MRESTFLKIIILYQKVKMNDLPDFYTHFKIFKPVSRPPLQSISGCVMEITYHFLFRISI